LSFLYSVFLYLNMSSRCCLFCHCVSSDLHHRLCICPPWLSSHQLDIVSKIYMFVSNACGPPSASCSRVLCTIHILFDLACGNLPPSSSTLYTTHAIAFHHCLPRTLPYSNFAP
jgi:hypothetical protein